MISTTIEQTKRLFELGLSPDSADMEYCYIDEFNSGLQVKGDINAEVDRRLDMMFGVTHIPAWSLSALLEVMPRPDLYRETADLWVCVTVFKEGSIRGFGETAIDAACDVITKIFVRGYLKKKGGQDEGQT